MKKLVVLSILMLFLFVLSGCDSNVPNDIENLEQHAEEIVSDSMAQPEPITPTHEQPIVLNEISFTFEGRDVEPHHAERIDVIRSAAIENFNLHRRPSNVVFTNDERTEIDHNTVRINPDSLRSLGAVFHAITTGIAVLTTHEVVHHITLRYFASPFNRWAEEGLAVAIEFIHASDDDVLRVLYLEEYGANLNDWQPIAAQEALLELSSADTMQDVCPIAILNFQALWQLTYFEENNEFFPYLFRWPSGRSRAQLDQPDGILRCYRTSGSFALFLLEIGNLDDYMVFHSNSDAAQEIYGMDLTELVQIWKYEHLQFGYWSERFSEFLMEYIENVLWRVENLMNYPRSN